MSSKDGQDFFDPADKGCRRALLIGIDYYNQSDPRKNLHGCVSDVNRLQDVLTHQGLVSRENIQVLCSSIPSGKYPKPTIPSYPGRDEIIAAIRTIISQSSQGDFVYFHFSGHGTRQDTVYAGKRGTRKDEALCCGDGSIIRDVEIDVLLNEMVGNGLKVLAVLDCCHSGGATRLSSQDGCTVRQREPEPIPEGIEWLGQDIVTEEDIHEGPSVKSDHWFWKDKAYHLIAACQPYELAQEFHHGNGQDTHGLLTFYLTECLTSLGPMMAVTTYHSIIQLLQAKCQSKNLARSQSPVLYGDANKVIFNLTPLSGNQLQHTMLTLVLRVEGRKAILGHGSVDGVSPGDVYQVSRPIDGDEAFQIQVVRVSEFESEAKATACNILNSHQFWEARLVEKANKIRVAVAPLGHHSDAFERVMAEWRDCVDQQFPVQFYFSEPFDNIDFFVRLKASEFQISDSGKSPLPNIPPLLADCQPGMTKRLVATLLHLSKYQKFSALQPERGDEYEGAWEFNVEPHTNTDTKRKYVISFTNNSPYTRVFISIFAVAPDWSIEQLIPVVGAAGEPVDPNRSIDRFRICMEIPPLLRRTKPKSMEDKLKVLVTTEAHDFSHWQISDIEKAQFESCRNVRAYTEGKFAVGERILVHELASLQ
ncbi:uncharacterized protein FRV6_14215 [Fusarium oxysporum]|uniref:Peptidase C14 caspase domain-containing protein n=1 Tax=Fusarium oxysporum TaxID=5507 RepID=A0A2H3TND7_FUSOX|nr:uncharacterized protein FRV6_14215 [Fusarium oxysporum]